MLLLACYCLLVVVHGPGCRIVGNGKSSYGTLTEFLSFERAIPLLARRFVALMSRDTLPRFAGAPW